MPSLLTPALRTLMLTSTALIGCTINQAVAGPTDPYLHPGDAYTIDGVSEEYSSVSIRSTGTLTIKNGGSLTTADNFYADAGGPTSVVVTGAGSELNVGSYATFGVFDSQYGNLTIADGAAITSSGSIAIDGNSTTKGLLSITGVDSQLTSYDLDIGQDGDAEVNLSAGTISTGGIFLGYSGSGRDEKGTLLISNNGSVEASTITSRNAKSNISIDGGTIRATKDNNDFITDFNGPNSFEIKAGGLKLDSVNFDIGVSSTISGVGSLTKTGTGTLTLSGTNTHSGGTTIQAGAISVDAMAKLGTGTTTLNGGALSLTHATGEETASDLALGTAGGTLDIVNAGALLAVTSDLSGAGSLTKTGAGTLTLSGTNTHSGGTTIKAGAISVDAMAKLGTGTTTLKGGALSLTHATGEETASALALGTAGGTLDIVNAGALLAVTSDLSGTGSLTKTGAGTLTLSGTNTYSGGTNVQKGILKGNTVSIQGNVNIAAAAELELDQSNDGVFDGDLSGAGQLTKSGTSTITLTGTNTYTGGTKINAGLLSISDMAQLGTGEILLNGGTFRTTGNSDLTTEKFDLDAAGGELDVSSKSFTLTGDVSTTSNLQKTGTGALVLDATSNTIGGGTSVQAGSLIVGSTSGMSAVKLISDVTIESSAVLGGHGTIVGDVTNNNGRIAPGNSIGTTTITGNYSGTGILQIEVEGDTKLADKLVVNGNVDVSGTDLDLVLTPANKVDWSIDPTGPFIIVENDGTDAITGTFASVTDNLLFINSTLDYAAGTNNNDIELTLTRNDIDFAESAQTANQKAAGSAAQKLGSGNAVYNALIATVSDKKAARAAFDSLSGEINASARGVLIENSRFVRNTVNNRLYATKLGKDNSAQSSQLGSLTWWNTAYGSWGKADADGNAASLDHSTGGVLFGADGDVFGNVRLGLTAGYSRTKIDPADRNSTATADNYTFGGYAGTQVDAFSVRGGAALTWHQIETERTASVSGGAFTDELKADQNAATLQTFAELGYSFDIGTTTFEPFAGLAFVHLTDKGFTEDGGAAALSAHDQSADVTFTTLGLRTETQFVLGGMQLTARGLAGWQHASDDTIDFTQSFASGGDAFTVTGTPIAQDIGILEAGLDIAINERAQFGFSYAGQLAKKNAKHGLTARLNLNF